MTDIKQAARWMQEGNAVFRPAWGKSEYVATEPADNRIYDEENEEWALTVDDLLADDWEIANG